MLLGEWQLCTNTGQASNQVADLDQDDKSHDFMTSI